MKKTRHTHKKKTTTEKLKDLLLIPFFKIHDFHRSHFFLLGHTMTGIFNFFIWLSLTPTGPRLSSLTAVKRLCAVLAV